MPAPERPRVLWPSFPPPGYLGQLTDEFQARLAEERAFVEKEDCTFYHVTELPDGETTDGGWDLRGCEKDYLGGVELDGRRVLEMGPATGHLTFYMESQGVDVVAFDAGFDRAVDLLPVAGSDLRAAKNMYCRLIGSVQNSWWYQHRLRNSRARVVYGDIYQLPGDLGRFDVVFYGCILLHLRDPFSALQQGAAVADDMIVVTDSIADWADDPMSNTMRFDPYGGDHLTNWWTICPGAVVAMLTRLGFGDITMTRHVTRHRPMHDPEQEFVDVPMYTVVARRST